MMVNDSVESMNILSCISECRVNAKIHGYGWLGWGVWGHHQAFVLRAPKWLVPALFICVNFVDFLVDFCIANATVIISSASYFIYIYSLSFFPVHS